MFSMRLEEITQSLEPQKKSLGYKFDIENIQDFLSLICEAMEDKKVCKFVVEGFGKSLWPVDVSTDLLSILEQLPDFLDFLYSNSTIKGYLDFYEQGIEKRLIFEKNNSNIDVACESLSSNSIVHTLNNNWGNNLQEDSLDKKQLENMLSKLINTFVLLIHQYFPQLTKNQFFLQWCNHKHILYCLNKNVDIRADS